MSKTSVIKKHHETSGMRRNCVYKPAPNGFVSLCTQAVNARPVCLLGYQMNQFITGDKRVTTFLNI